MTTLLDNVFGTYLGIEFQEDSIVITYLKNRLSGISLLSTATFPLKFEEAASDDVRGFISRHGTYVNKVFVSVPEKWAITKFIDIPSMKGKGKGALANLMKFEIERHIPFEIDDVAYDFLVMDTKGARNSVVFAAVQKDKINMVKDYLSKLSLQANAITISSFAVLNSIELSEVSVGGWQDIIGIVRRSAILGKKDEINVSVNINRKHASVAVISDGLCTHMRSFTFEEPGPPQVFLNDISQYLAEIQSSLSLEHFHKLLLSGDLTSIEALREELNEKIRVDVITVKQVEKLSGKLRGVNVDGASSSIGACFAGLGLGTYKINLLPHKADYEIRRIAPFTTKMLLVVIVALLVGIFSTEALRQKKFLEALEEKISKNEPEVKALEGMLKDIASLKERSDFLFRLKDSEIALEILSEFAKLMPKDSWVTSLNYKGIDAADKKKTVGELIISGYAVSSSNLISILEDSPYFEKVEFVGPIKKTKDNEQFKLSAKVVLPKGVEGGSE
ncbi:MAG: pilus assembly protein PilM [Nitrospirae bacterium]|nr:pilus assembly protein PilM [Nitrospirota bacterium]